MTDAYVSIFVVTTCSLDMQRAAQKTVEREFIVKKKNIG
jgi:hypothetical protein